MCFLRAHLSVLFIFITKNCTLLSEAEALESWAQVLLQSSSMELRHKRRCDGQIGDNEERSAQLGITD